MYRVEKREKLYDKDKKAPVKKKVKTIFSIEKIPDVIKCEYDKFYDIKFIHEIILLKLENEKNNINQLKQKLEEEISKLDKELYINDYKEILNNIDKLQDEIAELENNQKLEKYKKESEKIIKKYENSEGNERTKIIEKYFTIASNYIKLDIIKKDTDNDNKCKGCFNDIKKFYYTNDYGLYTCLICGTHDNYNNNYKSILSNTSQCSEIEGLTNYLKTLNRKQGLQNINIPNKLLESLDKYVQSIDHPIPKGEYFRSLPYNKEGRKDGTNHKMLYTALEKTGYSDYYEDGDLIAFYYWGWKLINFTSYMPILIDRYKKTQKAFENMPNKNRTSNINTQYRMFKDLEGIGFPCHYSEFKLPEDISEIEHIYKYMCDNSGDPNIKFIPTVL